MKRIGIELLSLLHHNLNDKTNLKKFLDKLDEYEKELVKAIKEKSKFQVMVIPLFLIVSEDIRQRQDVKTKSSKKHLPLSIIEKIFCELKLIFSCEYFAFPSFNANFYKMFKFYMRIYTTYFLKYWKFGDAKLELGTSEKEIFSTDELYIAIHDSFNQLLKTVLKRIDKFDMVKLKELVDIKNVSGFMVCSFNQLLEKKNKNFELKNVIFDFLIKFFKFIQICDHSKFYQIFPGIFSQILETFQTHGNEINTRKNEQITCKNIELLEILLLCCCKDDHLSQKTSTTEHFKGKFRELLKQNLLQSILENERYLLNSQMICKRIKVFCFKMLKTSSEIFDDYHRIFVNVLFVDYFNEMELNLDLSDKKVLECVQKLRNGNYFYKEFLNIIMSLPKEIRRYPQSENVILKKIKIMNSYIKNKLITIEELNSLVYLNMKKLMLIFFLSFNLKYSFKHLNFYIVEKNFKFFCELSPKILKPIAGFFLILNEYTKNSFLSELFKVLAKSKDVEKIFGILYFIDNNFTTLVKLDNVNEKGSIFRVNYFIGELVLSENLKNFKMKKFNVESKNVLKFYFINISFLVLSIIERYSTHVIVKSQKRVRVEFLKHTLFYIFRNLEREDGGWSILHKKSLKVLDLISKSMKCQNTHHLITENSDFIIEALLNNLQYLNLYPNTLLVIKNLFKFIESNFGTNIETSIEIFHLLIEIIEELFENITFLLNVKELKKSLQVFQIFHSIIGIIMSNRKHQAEKSSKVPELSHIEQSILERILSTFRNFFLLESLFVKTKILDCLERLLIDFNTQESLSKSQQKEKTNKEQKPNQDSKKKKFSLYKTINEFWPSLSHEIINGANIEIKTRSMKVIQTFMKHYMNFIFVRIENNLWHYFIEKLNKFKNEKYLLSIIDLFISINKHKKLVGLIKYNIMKRKLCITGLELIRRFYIFLDSPYPPTIQKRALELFEWLNLNYPDHLWYFVQSINRETITLDGFSSIAIPQLQNLNYSKLQKCAKTLQNIVN